MKIMATKSFPILNMDESCDGTTCWNVLPIGSILYKLVKLNMKM